MFRTNPKLWPENLWYIGQIAESQGFPPSRMTQDSVRLPSVFRQSLRQPGHERGALQTVMPKLSSRGTLASFSGSLYRSTLPSVPRAVGGCIWLRAHDRGFLGEVPTVETGLENSDAPTAIAPGTLMTGAHSPWPLFCNDLDQAQQWVSDQLRRTPTDKNLGTRP